MTTKRTGRRPGRPRKVVDLHPDAAPVPPRDRFGAVPDPPRRLGREGRAFWRRHASEALHPAYRRAHPAARELLEAAASCWEMYVEALRRARDSGPIARGSTGSPVVSPAIRATGMLHAQMLASMRELGLESAILPVGEVPDPWDTLLDEIVEETRAMSEPPDA